MPATFDVLVLGAGVNGLSIAHELAADGARVLVRAPAVGDATTSGVAAAFWYPFLAAPEDRVAVWAARSYRRFTALLDEAAAAVRVRHAIELFPTHVPAPRWLDGIPWRTRDTSLLPPGRAYGREYELPVIETPRYLPWLVEKVRELGVSFEVDAAKHLDEGFASARIVVDATGLGARELAADPSVSAMRGQIVAVRCPAVTEVWLDEHGPEGLTYVVPRTEDVIVGGTAEPSEDVTPDPATTEDVLTRATRLVPALQDAEVLRTLVGLRPARPAIRLEVEARAAGPVIHCYGHGGAGITLSWGCAEEVAALARDILR